MYSLPGRCSKGKEGAKLEKSNLHVVKAATFGNAREGAYLPCSWADSLGMRAGISF